ncbi:MAG: hypothetical protein V3S29_12980 [bacterium]
MTDHSQLVMAFLENWKPFAELPPGNPARRGVVRLIESDDPQRRGAALARVSQLAQLHEVYQKLGVRRVTRPDKSERFGELLRMPAQKMATALDDGDRREFLALLQDCFEFGRFAPESKVRAARQFLLAFWAMAVGAPPIKYSAYPNGVLFSLPGATHDEMASRFTKLGFGSGRPSGGGGFVREGELAFAFDTATTAFGSTMKPNFVTESLNKWIRQTGGDDEKVALTYRDKLGVL